MMEAGEKHFKAMNRVIKYCTETPMRDLTLIPNTKWDGSKVFEFEVTGISDSNYVTCSETRKSVSGYSVFLNGAPVTMKSGMQKIIALSVTEAKLFAATQCAQDMRYVMHILEGAGLKVKKPLELRVDNKGAIDLINNYSIGGRTKQIDVHQYFLRDLKENNIIKTTWIPGEENCSDLFTKNLSSPLFKKHAATFVSKKCV